MVVVVKNRDHLNVNMLAPIGGLMYVQNFFFLPRLGSSAQRAVFASLITRGIVAVRYSKACRFGFKVDIAKLIFIVLIGR